MSRFKVFSHFLSSSGKSSQKRILFYRLFGFLVTSLISVFLLSTLVPGFAPWAADTLRAALGPTFVAKLEDFVYGVKDKYEQFRHRNDAPVSYWSEPSSVASLAPLQGQNLAPEVKSAQGAPLVQALQEQVRPFPPKNFSAPYAAVALPQDGKWISVADDVFAESENPKDKEPVFAKALVHPDPKRPYSVVALVAVDLDRVQMKAVAGTSEPESETVSRSKRPGKIPEEDQKTLLAAMNGGWQAIHGHFGMMVSGLELLPPREVCCTLALYKDGTLALGTWSKLAETRSQMESFRQTPRCLKENGTMNEKLSEGATNWGTAVDGETIIRRSAIGLNEARNVLFYGVGDGQTARSIAEALSAAGAFSVAELDVNASFPRFLFYTHADKTSETPLVKESLIPCDYRKNEYVGKSWYRDFFYVTRKKSM